MKTMFGSVVALVGLAATLWGGFHCLTGKSKAVLVEPVNAMVAALAGVAMLTVGLLWTRD